MDVDAIFRGSEGARQYEGDSKQGGREDTALFDSALDGESVRECSVISHCAFHVAVKGCDHAQQLWWSADIFQ